MGVFKRGTIWWYKFNWNGEPIRESTKQSNKQTAEQMEAARRTELAKGEVGIRKKERAPRLVDFALRFTAAIETQCAEKPATVDFYQRMMRQLLADRELSNARLDAIDEAAIEGYKQRRSRQSSRFKRALSVATINRELATLRRLLRLVHEWRVLDRVPRIRLLRGERNREFVLSHGLEPKYLAAAPQPLRDVAVLMLETAVRPGEAVALQWADVHLEPAVHAALGYIAIRGGKSKNAKRNLSLTARAAAMLKARKAISTSVWCSPENPPKRPFSAVPWITSTMTYGRR